MRGEAACDADTNRWSIYPLLRLRMTSATRSSARCASKRAGIKGLLDTEQQREVEQLPRLARAGDFRNNQLRSGARWV